MKPLIAVSELLKSPKFVKITAFSLILLSLFFLAKHFTPNPTLQQSNDLPPPPPPSPPAVERVGIVDENGTMSSDFKIGEFDPNLADDVRNITQKEEDSAEQVRVKVKEYSKCNESMRDYIPCMDNLEAIRNLKSWERGERFERHCPENGKGSDCVLPRPPGYRTPIRWPQSRDEVWFSNVPHPRLVEDKGGQNWIAIKGDKFVFPGGGTQFIHGANQYLDQIAKMVPDIKFGQHTRVALDVGCGVASFGAFSMQRNVSTLSIAPKDVHENQIQFALERGVPAMVSAFVTHRLLYPSQAFDLIHCSRCRINWTRDDGILLLEVDRMLRAGGYFAWAAQPVYKHEKNLQDQWKEMEDLTSSICWQLVKKEGYIAIWQKPLNNSCYLNRSSTAQPPLCDPKDDPDSVWYVKLKPCITRLPDTGYGSNISTWPERLHYPPDRLQSIEIDAYLSRKELFKAESKYWRDIVTSFVNAYHWKELNLRNVMDMRAGFGGFAAAMQDAQIDCWVMNVVPVSGFNTLPVIYDRGLIGVMHDWCEPFDTYPRTYDLLHAASLFSNEKKRCDVSTIMLEMDRILRPDGHVYIRDSVTILPQLDEIATAIGWVCSIQNSAEGSHSGWKILRCNKRNR